MCRINTFLLSQHTDLILSADRVLWFRQEACVLRWREQIEIIVAEIERTELYYGFFAKAWEALSRSATDTGPHTHRFLSGKMAFCLKKRDLYRQLMSK